MAVRNTLIRPSTEKSPVPQGRITNNIEGDSKGDGKNTHTTVLAVCGEPDDNEHRDSVRSAVQATWAKANALQEQAIRAAVRAATMEVREQAQHEHSVALKKLEEDMQVEAEKANRRLWEIAAREKEVAIRKAIEDQAAEVQMLKDGLEQQKQKAAEDLENAYRSLKGEVSRVLEDQHSANMNMAVQAAWERAGRLEEVAVAAARKEARKEAESEFEKRLALERLEHGEERRKAAAEAAQAHADDMQSSKDEIRRLRTEVERLRQELERERITSREAESKAAKQQQQAVNAAVKAVEEVAQAAKERAVAHALAAAGVTVTSPVSPQPEAEAKAASAPEDIS